MGSQSEDFVILIQFRGKDNIRMVMSRPGKVVMDLIGYDPYLMLESAAEWLEHRPRKGGGS